MHYILSVIDGSTHRRNQSSYVVMENDKSILDTANTIEQCKEPFWVTGCYFSLLGLLCFLLLISTAPSPIPLCREPASVDKV
ncbi:hypothetical protein NQ317_002911 [Molorchus minor]|uniref:Uncharacterized protein n=1 Tax=Molorchus minor TaxID=1323400 RepID=A0ABQ9JM18_9CUCU|nr:hypothetical protein NQ317_002911 [Molorchus minor]